MNFHDYDVVFNIAQEPYTGWIPAMLGVAFIALGVAQIIWGEKPHTKLFGVVTVAFSLYWTALVALSSWRDYQYLRIGFSTGHFSDVEGVASYTRTDDASARLQVGRQTFILGGGGAGYNRVARAGGMNFNGYCVRVIFSRRMQIMWIATRPRVCTPGEHLEPGAFDGDGRPLDPNAIA